MLKVIESKEFRALDKDIKEIVRRAAISWTDLDGNYAYADPYMIIQSLMTPEHLGVNAEFNEENIEAAIKELRDHAISQELDEIIRERGDVSIYTVIDIVDSVSARIREIIK